MSVTSLIMEYANLSFIPPQYRWLVPISLVVVGILMMFRSRDTWKFLVAAIGGFGSYYAVVKYGQGYYAPILMAHGIPLYTIPLIAAVIGSIMLTVFVRFAISGAIGYGSFMYLGRHYSLDIAITAAVAIAGFSYYLYNKIILVLARFIGAFLLFIGLVFMHIPDMEAALIMAVLLILSMLWLVAKKKLIAMLKKLKAMIFSRKNTQSSQKKEKEVKKRMAISKIFSLPKKLIPHRKKADASEEQVVEEKVSEKTETTTKPDGKTETVTYVRADGTITTEVKK